MKLLLIGDVHGKIDRYEQILKKYSDIDMSFQLGDFGFKKEHDWYISNIDTAKHRIVFGNHDYWPYNFDGQYFSCFTIKGYRIATIAGAYSLDWMYRKEGVSWFKNEEMSYTMMNECIRKIVNFKPDIILSHECPRCIKRDMFEIYDDSSITGQGMQMIFEQHRPKHWFFGHHHCSKQKNIEEIFFKCLIELETVVFCS